MDTQCESVFKLKQCKENPKTNLLVWLMKHISALCFVYRKNYLKFILDKYWFDNEHLFSGISIIELNTALLCEVIQFYVLIFVENIIYVLCSIHLWIFLLFCWKKKHYDIMKNNFDKSKYINPKILQWPHQRKKYTSFKYL